ncbi:MAG TPA: PucR family transcriptional regulator ligand-binding domain-containing protein [Chondromyces sp.]|nr:PucR family transcriptional regulator ligand-binding domain-containing protein [Chondromyces sp.]
MTNHLPLTVKDVLHRRHFEQAEVIAGKNGLNKIVKWVHVVEVIKIGRLLKGHELILSTGVSFTHDKDLFICLIEELIESKASGICIEMGTYTSFIPQEIIDLADQHCFPIIIFHIEVPFVEITEDIHSYIINQQYQLISNLENYSQQLNKKILTAPNYKQILHTMQSYLNTQVIFQMNGKDPEYYPDVSRTRKEQLVKETAKEEEDTDYLGRQPIQLFGNRYGEVIIFSKEQKITEFDFLILDRTVTALSQYLLRDLYIEEKKRMEETKWLENWLEGGHTAETIQQFITYQSTESMPDGGTVLVSSYQTQKIKEQLDITYLKLLCRTIFEQQGFLVFVVEKGSHLAFILLNKRLDKNWKLRIEAGIQRLEQSDFMIKEKSPNLMFGVGKFVKELGHISKSYQTALDTIYIKQTSSACSHFFEDLHLFWLITQLQEHTNLQEIVLEHLEPILHYDKKCDGKLLETLKAYLASNGSKQETAKKLFIVRQTLYHRLNKIESLIGEDFMKPERRLALEFMLLVYDFLFQPKERSNDSRLESKKLVD